MIGVRGESAWQFVTSAGGGFTFEFFAGTGGEIVLRDPKGTEHRLWYGGAGIGVGLPFKIPRFGRLSPHRLNLHPYGRSVSASGSLTSFPNVGSLMILDSFAGPDLQLSDLTGGTIFAEVSFFVLGGVSTQAFLLGCNGAALHHALAAVEDLSADNLDRLPPFNALLLVAGVGGAVAAGASATAYAGYVG